MRRIIMVFAVGAIMAVMTALSAAPALADVAFDNGDIDFDGGAGFTSFGDDGFTSLGGFDDDFDVDVVVVVV